MGGAAIDMKSDLRAIGGGRRRRRRWQFGTAVFDEANWSLIVAGRAVTVESKPLELLHELCLRAGEVVSKDELLETVWAGVSVVENSLATAVAKLRRALGDDNQAAIVTVARVGYRLASPVSVETLDAPAAPRFAFAPGDAVPGRRQWRLLEPLGDSGAADVWRGRHEKTGEIRIFKFADAPDRLRALKREVAVSRMLLAALGPNGPFVPLLEWNFATAPYVVESHDAGLSLLDWARAAGGLDAIALEQRLGIAARCAHALAAVHAVGVLHKDIKPANILIDATASRVRLADFGSGRVFDDSAAAAYAITDLAGEPLPEGESDRLSGTPFYRAPELAAGAVATVKSDIYSLGLVLFQLAVGDFGRVPAPGWERDIDDPLLRDDIAAAAAGDPADRIGSAGLLADRLEALDDRRAKAAADVAARLRLDELAAAEAKRTARRPWVRAAAVAAMVGIVGTSTAAVMAVRQRDEARRQTAIAVASYGFLADDLLARVDPAAADAATETLADAARRAGAEIDRRYAGLPLVAARLHATLARAFQQRSEWADARREFDAAQAAFARAGASRDASAVLARLYRVQMEAASAQADGLQRAKRELTITRPLLEPRADRGLIGVALAQAEATIGYFEGDVVAAEAGFGRAAALAAADRDVPARDAIKMRVSHALTLMRLGRHAEAKRELGPAVARATALFGADHPDTLVARQNLLTALQLEGSHAAEVIAAATAMLPLFERRFGGDHRLTLALLSTRSDALAGQGRYRDAAADSARVWHGAAKQAGARSHQAIVGRSDLGGLECRAGDSAAGLADTLAALDDSRAAFGAAYPLTHAAAYAAGECLLAAGQPAAAHRLFATIDGQKVGQLVGDPRWSANLDLAEARVMLARQDLTRAGAHLSAATATLGDRADAEQRHQIATLADAVARRDANYSTLSP